MTIFCVCSLNVISTRCSGLLASRPTPSSISCIAGGSPLLPAKPRCARCPLTRKLSLNAASTLLPRAELHGLQTRSVVSRPPIARGKTCSSVPGRSLRQKMQRISHNTPPFQAIRRKAGSALPTRLGHLGSQKALVYLPAVENSAPVTAIDAIEPLCRRPAGRGQADRQIVRQCCDEH